MHSTYSEPIKQSATGAICFIHYNQSHDCHVTFRTLSFNDSEHNRKLVIWKNILVPLRKLKMNRMRCAFETRQKKYTIEWNGRHLWNTYTSFTRTEFIKIMVTVTVKLNLTFRNHNILIQVVYFSNGNCHMLNCLPIKIIKVYVIQFYFGCLTVGVYRQLKSVWFLIR